MGRDAPRRSTRAPSRSRASPSTCREAGPSPISKGLLELRPLLAAIQDPDDDVSVVAFLSGPLCGVDDDALYGATAPAGASRSRRPRARRRPEDRARARPPRDARKDSRAFPAGAALGLIVERLGLARLASPPEGGRTASGNLLKVLALARRLSGDGLSFADVVERLVEDAPPSSSRR